MKHRYLSLAIIPFSFLLFLASCGNPVQPIDETSVSADSEYIIDTSIVPVATDISTKLTKPILTTTSETTNTAMTTAAPLGIVQSDRSTTEIMTTTVSSITTSESTTTYTTTTTESSTTITETTTEEQIICAILEEPNQDPGFIYYEQYYDDNCSCYVDVAMSEYWQYYLYTLSQKYGLEFELLLAITGAETSFCVDYGYSANGIYYGAGMVCIAYALEPMQEIGINLFTPEGGLEAMCYFMAQKLNAYNNDIHESLTSYNRGHTGMRVYESTYGTAKSYYSSRVLSIKNGLIQWYQSTIN